MSIALDRFCCMVEFMIPSVAEFPIWMGVGGCGCSIHSSMISIGTTTLQLMRVYLHSDSEDADITFSWFHGWCE